MSRIRVASLFSGAGGLDLGFVLAGGYEIVFANEILRVHADTYSRNIGLKLEECGRGAVEAERGKVFACDVAQIDFTPLRGEADVLIGGPPCQDFSIIRGPEAKRKGIRVRRGRLYAHFVRALVQIQPKAFVFENVPGLVSANRGLAYRTILEDLKKLNIRWSEVEEVIGAGLSAEGAPGYEIIFAGIVDMSKLGVPQRRERLIIIGVRRDLAEELGAGVLGPEYWRLRAHIESALKGRGSPFAKFPLTPIEVFEGKPLPELGEKYREVMKEWEGVWSDAGTPRALEWKKRVWDELTFDVVEDYLRVNKIGKASESELERAFKAHEEVLRELGYLGVRVAELSPPDGSNRIPGEKPSVIERLKRIPPGENHEFVRGTRWEVRGLMSNIYRRLHPLAPAPTVIAYGGGGTWGYHYERSRGMLTNRERARLQTFPDWFLFSGGWSQVRAQIGEAVPPLASKRLAEALRAVLRGELLEATEPAGAT